MGTLGGSLCQRNRCWYFRDEHVNCLLKGGEKCFALDGENQYHAIFTQGHPCVIVHPSTLAPALIALGATAEVSGPKGKRDGRAGEVLPGARRRRRSASTSLAPNEMLVSVTIAGAAGAAHERQLRGAAEARRTTGRWCRRRSRSRSTAARSRRACGSCWATSPRRRSSSEAAAKALEGKEVTEATADRRRRGRRARAPSR